MIWPIVPFDEIISDSAFGPRFSSDCYDENGNVATLRTTDLSQDGFISLETMPHAIIDEEKFEAHFLRIDDLVISRSGRVGTTAIFNGYHKPVLPGAFLIRFRLNCSRAAPLFYRYFFNSTEGQQLLLSVAQGAAQQNINITNVRALDVPLPPLAVQQRIASVLSHYDELIDANRRRIQLLEESVRLLYREFFVNLRRSRFKLAPGADGLPEGWRRLQLADICCQVKEQADPTKVDSDTPYLSMEHMEPKSLSLGEWETAGKVNSSKLRFQRRDVLFGRIRPYFHKVGIAQVDGITSTDMIVARPNSEELLPLVALTMSSDEFVAHAVATSNGTKMPRADWKVLREWSVLLPGRSELIDFSEKVLPVLDLLESLSSQNRLLRSARCAFMPKLMSGELSS